jgi:hypothetical protein
MVNAQATVGLQYLFCITDKIVIVCIFMFFNYTFAWTVKQGVLSQYSVSFIASSNEPCTFVPASLFDKSFLRVAFLLLMISIFCICWMKWSVLLYYSPIILAKLIQARPFPREDEWTTEWHKPANYLVYIVLFGANVNTLWCKLFESSVSEKCFSIIPFNFTISFIFSSKCFPYGRCLVEYACKCASHTSEYLRQFLWSFAKQDMIFWTSSVEKWNICCSFFYSDEFDSYSRPDFAG